MKKIAFWGTDDFSVAVLNTLKETGVVPALIITTPDRPKGRKLELTPPEAKVWAQANNIDYIQPEKIKDNDDLQSKLADFDLSIVASYGKIIPPEILSLPRHETLNIHPSLLPKYRGATPVESAILNNDDVTGVTIIVLDQEMDHGPVVAQKKFALNKNINAPLLRQQLAQTGALLLKDQLENWCRGVIVPTPQDHELASYCKKITKEDGLVEYPIKDSLQTYNQYRAFDPWPGIYFFIQKAERSIRIVIKKARLDDNGNFVIERVIPEGKKEMDWASFQQGYLK